MRNYEFLVKNEPTAGRILGTIVTIFLSFVAGSFFGYLWMSHAYGLWN